MVRGNLRTMFVVVLGLITFAALGCGKKAGGGGSGKPKIAVSIFPLYDITRRIGGDRLDVVLVLPPGKSEHGYEATPKEIARLDGAKLGIAVGLEMDSWVERIMASAGGATIVRIGDRVKTMPIDVEPIGEDEAHHDEHGEEHHEGSGSGEEHHEDEDHHELGAPDPHFWMDPSRMVEVVDLIAGELVKVDPAGKDQLLANAETVKTELKALDAAIAARAKGWTKRTIVTFHGSMQYYAKRYDIRIAAVVEPLAGKEPTAAYIGEVLGAIKRGGAAALFSEPQLDRAPAQTIATEAGIPLGELDPVGGVAGRDSYDKLVTWNTDQLEKVLK